MSDNINRSNYPIPSVVRLPVYLRYLKEARTRGETVVSCTRIAEEFSQLSVQVRKDLAITGISGRPKVGYQVDQLIGAIESFLGWDRAVTAFLVGAGSLGSAILGYPGFVEHGLRIVGVFDSDPKKVGMSVHGCRVCSISEMAKKGKETKIDIGILTVPAASAQDVANRLVALGVRGIWNYTPHRLDLPPHIICEDVKLSATYATLTHRLLNQSPPKP